MAKESVTRLLTKPRLKIRMLRRKPRRTNRQLGPKQGRPVTLQILQRIPQPKVSGDSFALPRREWLSTEQACNCAGGGGYTQRMKYFYDEIRKELLILEEGSIRVAREMGTDIIPGEVSHIPVEDPIPEDPEEEIDEPVVRKTRTTRVKKEVVSAKEDGPNGKSAMVAIMIKDGLPDNEICDRLGIKLPALGYHKRKLGLSKRQQKASKGVKEKPIKESEKPWDPEPTEKDVERAWNWVDLGVTEYEDIAKKMGIPESVVEKALLKPRP